MATFYHSSTNPRDAIANLYLSDPAGHVPYPESAVSGNTVYLNYSSSSSYSETLAGSTQPQSNCIGFSELSSHLGVSSYNSWRDGRNETLFMQSHGESINGGDGLFQNSVPDDPRIGLETELGILNGHDLSLHQSNMSSGRSQGLSLSLRIPLPSFKDVSALTSHQSNPGSNENYRDTNSRSGILNATTPYEITNIMSTISDSKYLKAAQQLLDEIVTVQSALKHKTDYNGASKSDGNHSNHQEFCANSPFELSPSEKQELHNKITKLLSMFDE
ncbi:BEL1-like homeodomain protein 3 [Platanthera guangdongensis]|uniref:BEL1-like homeodomain protein 3 n=1 Tax=Platanthera guangdongensis TaxID=2320717 RepID=A0ABR2LY20_9ASPA